MFLKLILPKLKPKKQQGSAIVLALFIIVVMSLLGAAMVRMLSANAENIVYEVVGTRAYFAAQAGMQRSLAALFPLNPATVSQCPTSNPVYSFTTINGLTNCQASVECSAKVVGNPSITYYTLTSTGQCSVASITTTRTIEVQAKTL
jgi:MSHA biogenesis protein MshP